MFENSETQGGGVPAFGGGEEPGPASTQPSAGQPAAPSQPEPPLTRAELRQLLESHGQALRREIQSKTDQAAERIQRRYQATVDVYAQAAEQAVAGGFIPADKKEAYAQHLRAHAAQTAMTPEPPAQRGQQRPTPPVDPEGDAPDAASVSARGQQLAQQFGLAEGDPELEHVYTAGTPDEYLASIVFAGRAKARRLAAAGGAANPAGDQPGAPPTPPAQQRRPAAARAPGVGAGGGQAAPKNPIANINDPDALFALEWQQSRRRD